MTPTYPLTLTRNRGWYGRLRALQIWAKTPTGRVHLGKVALGGTLTLAVPEDATQIYGKMDWAKTVPLDLAFVGAGETVYANLWFTLNPFRNLGIPTIPGRIETVAR